ncbi:hypothetical protein AAL_01386 [Moelleriella libera RCEF 2490]|uniref:Uncharacterized protein n=1 Tax=Moelleriella libera RCEF 2490 TaxID=1081109 RepID=A0A166U4Q1_9HYPO|nr:hypothetical protein AAL_01386 [Moelleriella libera RCEF 2490]
MSPRPSTPVKVPASAANNTPATLDPDMRSQINTLLLRDGHVSKIQDALLHALNSNSSNWPTLVQSHALSLLRTGEITTFPLLLRRIIDDVREASSSSTTSSSVSANGKASGATTNGDSSKRVNGTSSSSSSLSSSSSPEKPNLAVPDAVVEEALRVTRESLEAVCEMDEQGTS